MGSNTQCEAAFEDPKHQPLVCKCQNGGFCVDTGSSQSEEAPCLCPDSYVGAYCEHSKKFIGAGKSGSTAAVFVPIFLIIVVIVSAVALYVYYQRKRGEPKFVGGISNSVSFRQGTNVEFEGPSFVEGGEGGAPNSVVNDNRDFSNPMYDMNGPPAGGQTAVLAPSSVSHIDPVTGAPEPPAPAAGQIKHRELSPVTIDTGKDTQCLVEDDSEC